MAERLNAQSATQALLFKMAVSAIPNERVKPSATKKMSEQFGNLISKMMGTG